MPLLLPRTTRDTTVL